MIPLEIRNLKNSEIDKFLKDMKNIPEISDLLVLNDYQRQGIGERLISYNEKKANNLGYRYIGLGVGLYEDYKPACKLYNKLNYKLDGQGIYSNYKKVIPGETVIIGDDLIIWLVKELE
ncbi:GNAT family N-acetyltransferase [Francisella sp. Scap27]|uniref:GNAT family N-acetyltransferase n=1 Tax=Francisella sp. Scap27 TaxID=2589986 RepID=UPI0015BFBB1F|nr:GNAT family N-acetyltransferase [Francisella sp. Scap27]QLE78369.1 GNAT family N-acetyltransferase [Francisella sp. Scap27]